MKNRSRALQAYHRQVREVIRQSGVSYADARRAVKLLRESDTVTAAATKRNREAVMIAVREAKAPYANLSDYIATWSEWDEAVYEDYEVETGVDY